MKKVLIFAEEASSYEELCSGVHGLDAQPVALWVGDDEGANRIASFGATVMHCGEKPEDALLEGYADAFADVIKNEAPDVILFRSSKRTQCLAGLLSVACGLPVVSDVSSVHFEGDSVLMSHLVFGGAANQVERASGCVIGLVGSGVFEVVEAIEAGEVSRISAEPNLSGIKLVSVEERQEETVDLGAAKYVICAGRGIGTEENLSALTAYASTQGAEMACTRPIAEGEGWMARSRYLGVSGALIKPDLYLGAGVSGQVQHTVGIADAKTIAVINKDKNAPLFKNCDFGLVADIEKVLPLLSEL